MKLISATAALACLLALVPAWADDNNDQIIGEPPTIGCCLGSDPTGAGFVMVAFLDRGSAVAGVKGGAGVRIEDGTAGAISRPVVITARF